MLTLLFGSRFGKSGGVKRERFHVDERKVHALDRIATILGIQV